MVSRTSAAAGARDGPAQRRGAVRRDAEEARLTAGLPHRRGQGVGVRLDDLARPGAAPQRHHLVAGGQDGHHAGVAPPATRTQPSAAARPMAPGSSRVPAGRATAPRATSLPAGRTKRPASPARSKRASAPRTATRSCISTPSAPRGSGAPVKIRRQAPGRSVPGHGWPAATVPSIAQPAAGAGQVAGAEGEAVHGGGREGGQRRAGAEGRGQRPPRRLGQRHPLGLAAAPAGGPAPGCGRGPRPG